MCWYTREDLNLHAARAAASEAAASAVSPRVHCWCRNGGSNAGYRLTKAVPCHWTIAAMWTWCWLEDSNLPPLAYEASALPDELSQRVIGAGFTLRSGGSSWLEILDQK